MRIHVDSDEIVLRDAEILRYLGYGGQAMSEQLLADIARCKQTLTAQMQPRFVCETFTIEQRPEGVALLDTPLVLPGGDIAALLARSRECVLMAATLGSEADRAIQYGSKRSASEGLILDAVATEAIEALCDAVEDQLRQRHPVTYRFSCGYGDLPLSLQPQILAVLGTQKAIGLHCNENHIMMPRKSVTAILGILEGEAAPQIEPDCRTCAAYHSCNLQKGGKGCGAFRLRTR